MWSYKLYAILHGSIVTKWTAPWTNADYIIHCRVRSYNTSVGGININVIHLHIKVTYHHHYQKPNNYRSFYYGRLGFQCNDTMVGLCEYSGNSRDGQVPINLYAFIVNTIISCMIATVSDSEVNPKIWHIANMYHCINHFSTASPIRLLSELTRTYSRSVSGIRHELATVMYF